MRTEKVFDLVVWLFIATVGLVAAYICFGILSSQASGQYQQYSVGGAIAGALISWSVLTSVYLQLRGSSNELQDLRKRTEELQAKLIRGAPHPQGFDIEVDERQRIVLARPRDWEPKGGTIFELQLPDKKMASSDNFPAYFRCYFIPIEEGSKQTRDEFHAAELGLAKDAARFVQSYSHEVVRLGGESAEVESLKLIVNQVVRTVIKKPNDTGRCERSWDVISWPEFVGEIDNVFPLQLTVDDPVELNLYGTGFRIGTTCYVNGKKRETHVVQDWQVNVKLLNEDVAMPGVMELVIENPETRGKKSTPKLMMVVAGTKPKPVVSRVPASQPEKEPALAVGEPALLKDGDPADNPKPAAPGKTATSPKPDQPRVVYHEVVRMRVACYHEQLRKIYYFEFWDDLDDFLESSSVFNRIIASTRFLD